MSRFATELRVEHQSDGQWCLLSDLVYCSERDGAFIVPEGYLTDFASVPRLPVVYWLAGDTAHEAAVLHDWLYTSGRVTRGKADALFREASAASGVPWWRRWLMWAGVRVGGWSGYQGAA
jgi:hypothetical protein